MLRALIAAAVFLLTPNVPVAHAMSGSWWLMNNENWTCLSAPEAELIAKKPDGAPRAMEQNLYRQDGTVTPLFWFAAKADCESWLAQLREKGLAKAHLAPRVR